MKKIYLILTLSILLCTGCNESDNAAAKNTIAASKKSTEKVVVKEDSTTTSKTATTETEVETTTVSETTTVPPMTTEPPTTTVPPTTTEPPTTTVPPTTTQPPTTAVPPTEATTAKYIVDYSYEESSSSSNYKYGLTTVTTTTYCYYVYSDGSKELYDSYSYDSFVSSGYTATDAELLSESNSKSSANMAYYNEVLALVNQIRSEAGVHPLTLDASLCQAATMRSVEMNYSQLFSHTRPNGSTCFSVFSTYNINYGAAGENIAAGYWSPADVVEGWKNSPGHYANMINASFNKLGVGMSNETIGYGIYWTQLFTD